MADIFISYSKKDRARIQPVLDGLKRAGFSVWFDEQIDAVDRWDERIERELEAAPCVLVLWTANALASDFVKDESRWALERGKLIQARLEACVPPLGFRGLQYVDLSRWRGQEDDPDWRKLLHGVAVRLGRADAPSDIAPIDPPPPRSWTLPVLALGAAIVAGGLLVAFWLRSDPPLEPETGGTSGNGTDGEVEVADTPRFGPGAAPEPGTVFRDCAECPEMVVLPTGSFMMGSPAGEQGRASDEGPQRVVEIAYPLAVGRYEVTWEEWEACVADRVCDAAGPAGAGGDNGWGVGRRPVIEVDWQDTQDFVRWLNGKVEGEPYRLPTEAEWEYAARGVTSPSVVRRYSWGDQGPVCEETAPNGANFSACRDNRTRPVGSFRNAANAFGLYDMHGNVYEWIEDCWHSSYEGDPPADGSAWREADGGDCSRAVVRGGSWYNNPQFLRSAYRNYRYRDDRNNDIGFRLARTLPGR